MGAARSWTIEEQEVAVPPIGSRQAVEAPPAVPPLYSLLIAAGPIEDGARWQLGTEWSPEQKGGGAAVAANCAGNTPDGKATRANPRVNTADPFTVYAEDHCSTFGYEARDFEGRARRQLAATQSFWIASEFQRGNIRDSANLDNPALVDATEVGPGERPIEDAIAMLEGVLAQVFNGVRCMIHVTPGSLIEMSRKNLIERSGGLWITALGTIVVSDAGYGAETTPEGAVFAYGTSMVRVRLSPVGLVPGSWDEALARAQMIDRHTNDVVLRAERMALIEFDSSNTSDADLMFKVELDVPAWHIGS